MALFLDEVRLTRDALRYGFAVGKVRVLETRALDRSASERLLDAPSFAEQKRLLSDTPYGRYLESATTAEEVEEGLDAALDGFYRFLKDAELPPAVVRFFRVRPDFRNLKGALKARVVGASLEGLLVPHGTVPLEAFSRDLTELPEPLGLLAQELLADEDAGPAELDRAVDAALFAELGRLAREARSAYLAEIAALMVDLANAKVLIRTRLAGMDPRDIAVLFFDGGKVPVSRFTAIAEMPASEVATALQRVDVFKSVDPAALASADTLDPATDGLLFTLLGRGRRGPEGPEPVIAYVFARETEVATLRVLLLGRLSGIDTETLRARLRTGLN